MQYHNALQLSSISSTAFTFNNFISRLDDDGLVISEFLDLMNKNKKVFVNSTAGTVDYSTGKISINNFIVSAFDGIEIKVNANPANKDIVPVREQI